MFKKTTIAGNYFISSFVVLFLLFSALAYFWLYQEHSDFEAESDALRARYIESQKERIQNEVERVIDFIAFKKSQTADRVKRQIKARVYEAHAVATHVYELHKGSKTPDELKSLVREALRPIRFNQGRGYFFATALDGREELFADRPELEGKNLIQMQDTKGKPVIRDMVQIARDEQEGFYEYTWTKPMSEGRTFPKIAFVKHFEPFDWLIGTGEYLDDTEREIQQEVLERISKIRFGKDGYVFAFDFNGTPLSHINPTLVGKNILDLTDPNGVKIIRELLHVSQAANGGFVTYVWDKPSLARNVLKLGYAQASPDWKWVIGTGIYMDDMEEAIAERLVSHRQRVGKHMAFIVTLFALSIVVTVFVLRFFSRRIQKGVDAFAAFFEKSAFSHEKIDATHLPFSEFEALARFSNKMVEDRAAAETELKKREATLRSIFSAAPIGIGLVRDRILEQVNEKICRMLGYTKQELEGHSARVLYPSEAEFERVGREKYTEIRQHGIGTVETQWKRKDGALIDVLLSSAPLNPSDLSAGFTFTVLDITERKLSEKEKSQLRAQLQRVEKMEALGSLAGGVAHDLNNILGGLVSYPDLLLMDLSKDDPMWEPLSIIQKSGKKAAAIVQDLLTLARRGVAVKEVVNLNEIIKDYLESPEHKKLTSYHPGVVIRTDLGADLLDVEGSSVHLSKTIMNLVSNAAEAVIDSGEIAICTRNEYVEKPIRGYDKVEAGDYVVLTVTDTGSGILPEDLEKIFEPFFTKKNLGRSGTGLGMAVVWGTVKDHQGYIDVQSGKAKGTTFNLYLPVTRKRRPAAESANTTRQYAGQGETVLVVDDVEEQRMIASILLTRLGYRVEAVSSGEEAVAFMEAGSADILILDMIMPPGIDGLDTYKKILQFHPGQKAIIASGFSETERVKEAQQLGANQYLRKPYTLEKIGLAVKEALAG